MSWFDRQSFLQQLSTAGGHRLERWCEQLHRTFAEKWTSIPDQQQATWQQLFDQLPPVSQGNWQLSLNDDVIEVAGKLDPAARSWWRDQLISLAPWRTGPFRWFGIDVDAEWQSFMKWNRVEPAVYFDGARVLDVGCNNGYFCFRSIAAGAVTAVGCDPLLLYNIQHEIMRRYVPHPQRVATFPIADWQIPPGLNCFDVVLSMGVLYHRTSPIDHLNRLRSTLRKRGQLVLETIAYDSNRIDVLVPEGKFAKMRGIWFVPTIGMLKRWLQRTGFVDVRVIDVSMTSALEQRSTEFMPFESWVDFIDPADPSRTVEGYEVPPRVILTAVANRD